MPRAIEAADAVEVEDPLLLTDETAKVIFYVDHIFNDKVRVVSEYRLPSGKVMLTTEWLGADDSLTWRDPVW